MVNVRCNREAGWMALLSLILMCVQAAAFWLPLFTRKNGPVTSQYYFSRSCSYFSNTNKVVCQAYPGNYVCESQHTKVSMNLGAIALANFCCLLGLILSCCAGKCTHGVLFALSFISSAVSIGITIPLSSSAGCSSSTSNNNASSSTTSATLRVGFYLLCLSMVVSLAALFVALRNKAFCCCEDVDDDHIQHTTVIVASSSPSSSLAAGHIEYKNYQESAKYEEHDVVYGQSVETSTNDKSAPNNNDCMNNY